MNAVYDVVIIGGGVSGLMAAITLADAGRKVAVVSKGDPACCFSTGCVDLLAAADDPLQGIGFLPEEHPYHLVGQENIIQALDRFRSIMSEEGMPYVGDYHANRRVLTSLGRCKITCLVPQTMAFADVDFDTRLHVLSFKRIKDFYPQYITARYPNARYSTYDAGVTTSAGIAGRFENSQFLEEFITWVQRLDIQEERVALPAVLGRLFTREVYEKIAAACGRPLFEIPTLPPSMPGLRLFGGLKNALLRRKGDLYWGRRIYSVERIDHQIEAVTLAGTGRTTRVEGRTFILATGSLVSGGLHASMENVTETVFDLPTYLPGTREAWFHDDFFAPGHEIEKTGIRVDTSFRPLDTDIENLYVCGSILAFSEVMKHRCGHGMAIATGVGAAKACGGLGS